MSAALCTTLGCLLNGAAIAYTGPAIPSLTNITGDPNDGGTVWGGDIRVDAQEASWIGNKEKRLSCVCIHLLAAGMLQIGSLLGCLLAGVAMERFGRRFTLRYLATSRYSTVQYSTVQYTLRYLATSSFLLGFLTILLAPSAPLIYLGRFLTGAGMGAVMATATIYIVEIASTVVLSNFDIDVQ